MQIIFHNEKRPQLFKNAQFLDYVICLLRCFTAS